MSAEPYDQEIHELEKQKTESFGQARKHNNRTFETYEQKIHALKKQRTELLDVNKQWDQQFRQMKQFYENKVAGLNVKLTSLQLSMYNEHRLKQKENSDKMPEEKRCLHHLMAKDSLIEKLKELKEENEWFRKQNTLFSRRKDHYEHEIDRLNKALSEAVIKEISQEKCRSLNPSLKNVDDDDLLTQIEVLKQQIQIYEEDFKRERADRERISQEKEELQKTCERLRFQFSKIKTKPDYQWYVPDQFPPDVRQKENGASVNHNSPLK